MPFIYHLSFSIYHLPAALILESMTADRSLTVLLICHDRQRHARLLSLLEAAHLEPSPVDSQGHLLAPEHVGLMICDTPLDGNSNPLAAELRPQLEQRNIGMIAIGWPGPAEVVLPADVSDRELLNCLRLVYERVRLWRLVQSLAGQQKSLVEQALMDVITGLPNRRAWEEQFVQRVEALRSAGATAVWPSWTSIISNKSTTRVGTPWAIRSCEPSAKRCGLGFARPTSSRAWGATSSAYSSTGSRLTQRQECWSGFAATSFPWS